MGVLPEHKDILAQVPWLRNAGKSDWDIEVILNNLLDEKVAKAAAEAAKAAEADPAQPSPVEGDGSPPPRITVDMIRNYMLHYEEDTAKEAASGAQKKGAKKKG